MSDLKKVACDAIDAAADELQALSDDIWNHPELGLSETHAHQVLTRFLDQHGFQVCCTFLKSESSLIVHVYNKNAKGNHTCKVSRLILTTNTA